LAHPTFSQNGSTRLIDLLARREIYGTAETNVNRKIIPNSQILDFAAPRVALAQFSRIAPAIPQQIAN
jgi:hypothetical protein